MSVAACFAVSAPHASAVLPTGATGVVGVTGIAQSGSTLTVSTVGNSVLNYTSFSIGAGATVQINQQSAAFASLQRVIGAGGVIPQSVIDGMLQSNGRVFLLNPSGIVIGAGARIDVAGFVASSLSMSDDDFLKGRMRFTENAAAKAVKNYGTIQTASGGHVYLVAPEVENHGIIRAPQGQIILAAGKSAELVSDDSPYVTVKVVADTEKALNVGKLIADSGSIGIFGALVQHSGVAEANGAVAGPGGQIRFVATKDLTIDAGSRISANGTSGGKVVLQAEGGTNFIGGTVEATGSSGKGGEVQALGVRVGVIGQGIIDASGETGGGTVLVGGDYQGKNSAVQNAERTYIGPDGVIHADARTNGDGGRVIVWADGDTRFYGSISARGGSQSGNGGFVETSGKQHLVALGSVNASAPHGKAGTWLLDPEDIQIVAFGGRDDGQIYGDGILAFGDPGDAYGLSIIGTDGIYGAMYAGTDVLLQANNSIALQTTVDTSAYAGRALTLQAGNEIDLSFYSITTDGNLTLSAPTITSSASGVSHTLSSLNGFTTLAGTTNLPGGLTVSGAAGVSTGDIITNNYDSRVQIDSSAGSITTGMIKTSDANDGSAVIQMTASYGTITTGDLSSGGQGGIFLSAGSNITTGNLSTRPSDPQYSSGNVSLSSTNGRVVVNGNIDTRGSDGVEFNQNGKSGGSVFLQSSNSSDPAAVSVAGLILTSGGNGLQDSYGNAGYGGNGGSVSAYGFAGGVSIGGIQTLGGAGATNSYGCCSDAGLGGSGGGVFVSVAGPISIGSIETRGGAGGDRFVDSGAGGDGGSGGSVSLNGSSVAANFIDSRGGPGGFSLSYLGGSGGSGGSVNINATSDVNIPIIEASGAAGGSSGFVGGDGGFGGSVSVSGNHVALTTLVASRGGAGGDGMEGGNGGSGSSVFIDALSSVNIGVLDLSGGNAGTSSGSSFSANSGGSGGFFDIESDGTVDIKFILAKGGAGSNGTATSQNGGFGGDGGEGFIFAATSLTIGPKPLIGKAQGVVDLSGGAGGSSLDGFGGGGGFGGSLNLEAPAMTINGVIVAKGAAGGAGATPGSPGDGGFVDFTTSDGLGSITFVNGGWDLTAGAGGIDGKISGNFFSTTIPAPLDVAKFIYIGPGDLADIPVTDVGIFRFKAISDPLSVPEILQVVGVTIQETQKVAESGTGDKTEKEDKDKEKTGSLGSCRPS